MTCSSLTWSGVMKTIWFSILNHLRSADTHFHPGGSLNVSLPVGRIKTSISSKTVFNWSRWQTAEVWGIFYKHYCDEMCLSLQVQIYIFRPITDHWFRVCSDPLMKQTVWELNFILMQVSLRRRAECSGRLVKLDWSQCECVCDWIRSVGQDEVWWAVRLLLR